MPSTDALEAAGRRAAFGPVPSPPSIEALAAEVDRRRSKRRRVVGGVTAALVAAVAIPIGVSQIDDGRADVMTLASDDGDEALSSEPVSLASQTGPSPTSDPTTVPSSTPLTEDAAELAPFADVRNENFDLRLDLGEESFEIAVLHGEEALSGADDAAADADETREIDGRVIWLDEQGDQLVASALFGDDTFVRVTGPRDQIEHILDLVTEHATGPLKFFDLEGFGERFDLPEGFLDGDGLFDEGLPFENGDLPFLEERALDEFRDEMKDFSECLEVTIDRTGSTTMIEIPDCELPELDGLLDGLLNDVPFDLEKLFDDLENTKAN